MLRCNQIAHQASEYIDQQHSLRQRMAFRLHLSICRNCRRYISQLRSSIDSLKRIKLHQPLNLTEQQQQLARQLAEQVLKR